MGMSTSTTRNILNLKRMAASKKRLLVLSNGPWLASSFEGLFSNLTIDSMHWLFAVKKTDQIFLALVSITNVEQYRLVKTTA
jgi:hypothetical protein